LQFTLVGWSGQYVSIGARVQEKRVGENISLGEICQ
jgi:hypothetical protein